MTRDEQELAVAVAVAVAVGVAMTLWRETYEASRLIASEGREAEADAAVEAFHKRYLPQTSAPPAAWYDEPPRPGEYFVEGLPRVCWVDEDVVWCPDWDRANERPMIRELPRDDRRVCPIIKPPEPTR